MRSFFIRFLLNKNQPLKDKKSNLLFRGVDEPMIIILKPKNEEKKNSKNNKNANNKDRFGIYITIQKKIFPLDFSTSSFLIQHLQLFVSLVPFSSLLRVEQTL